jgi:DNA-binding NarL/FixJ family response regulator
MPPPVITIAIVDDHTVVRDGLCRILQTEPGLKVVATAASGVEAAHIVRQVKPDIMLLDIYMANASGLDVLREFPEQHTRFLVLTAAVNRIDLLQAVRLHAHGIVTKDAPIETLIKAIHHVAAGEYWIPRDLLDSVAQQSGNRSTHEFGLTERELDIVDEIVAGASNKSIANKLSISELTVKRHLTNIYEKVGISSRLELATFFLSRKQTGLK